MTVIHALEISASVYLGLSVLVLGLFLLLVNTPDDHEYTQQ